jgi:hypothetical protein
MTPRDHAAVRLPAPPSEASARAEIRRTRMAASRIGAQCILGRFGEAGGGLERLLSLPAMIRQWRRSSARGSTIYPLVRIELTLGDLVDHWLKQRMDRARFGIPLSVLVAIFWRGNLPLRALSRSEP